MLHEFSREALLLGEDAVTRLRACRVAIFGIGGVGGYVAEALARGGVGQRAATLDVGKQRGDRALQARLGDRVAQGGEALEGRHTGF